MKKITRQRFDSLVKTKQLSPKYSNKFDAYITWDCHDYFQLAGTAKQAKDNLFTRINEGWNDPNPDNQEHD